VLGNVLYDYLQERKDNFVPTAQVNGIKDLNLLIQTKKTGQTRLLYSKKIWNIVILNIMVLQR
jgi:hypothetical protein